jgi:hypothetical protein
MTVTHNLRTFKPATERAHGSCRWSLRPILPTAGNINGQPGLLTITTDKRPDVQYLVTALAEQFRDGVVIRGFAMTKADGKVHHLDADEGLRCDCEDATFHPERPGGCRHQAALRAALATIGLHYTDLTTPPHAPASKPAFRSAGDYAANDPQGWDDHAEQVA